MDFYTYLNAVAMDSASLAEHDKRFHPNGYREGQKCSLRNRQKNVDKSDDLQRGATHSDDAAYLAAAKNGDYLIGNALLRKKANAQPFESAQTGKPITVLAYHGTMAQSPFTQFVPKKGLNIDGIYFSKDRHVASHWSGTMIPHSFDGKLSNAIERLKTDEEIERFAKEICGYSEFKIVRHEDGFGGVSHNGGSWSPIREIDGKLEKPEEAARDMLRERVEDMNRSDRGPYGKGFLYETFLHFNNPYVIDAEKKPFFDISFNGEDGLNTETIFSRLPKEYDGLIIRNVKETDYANQLTDDAIVRYPEQVKITNPFTYDGNGNPIPLSQRLNAKSKDMRC